MIKLFIDELSIFLKDGFASKEEIMTAWSKAVAQYKLSYVIFSSKKEDIINQTKNSLKN